MTKKTLIVDGNFAAAEVAYRCSEFSAIYPITPSSTMGELADEWAFQHKKNIWGNIPSILEMQSEAGAAGTLHGALQMGNLCTTFTASQGLLLMIPNMYKIAGELSPFVMHVAARTVATHALSIFGDHSDVMACRGTGFAMLCSNTVQEAHDMAAIAHASTLESRVPFLHFFDGFRTSHEIAKIDYIENSVLEKMLPLERIISLRSRAMKPENPYIKGTAQNPDVYFQAREASNPYYNNITEIVKNNMKKFAELTGREYNLVEYIGDEHAENVLVIMGSGASTVQETLPELPSKTGLVKIHLYRPFPSTDFVNVLPKSVKKIAVLDRTKEPGATGEPLYLDVITALHEAGINNINVYGGRYGLSSKEFRPKDVKAVFDMLMSNNSKREFTVGITDDVTKLSLDTDDFFTLKHDDVKSALMWGLGSDGTVGASKNVIKIVGEESDLYPQGYAVYDSKKSGSVTASHLRFSKNPILSQYLVESADFISCSQFPIAQRLDIFKTLKPLGIVLINTSMDPKVAFKNLPRETQEFLLRQRAKIYFIDANRAAAELGLGKRINTFILANFFYLSKIIDPKIAFESMKTAIEKTYRKKGDEIVQMNLAAIDRAPEFLVEFTLPTSVTPFASDFIPPMVGNVPDFVKNVLGEISAGRGDELPTSAFNPDGSFPSATSQYEKRYIADRIPTWDNETCIQCGKCAFVCPHSAIRLHVNKTSDFKNAPDGFVHVPYKTPELGPDLEFALTVSAADCTGCGVCVKNCPAATKANPHVKAIKMTDIADVSEKSQRDFDYAETLPPFDKTKLNLNIPKHTQLLETMFEFPGACGGCGETPYLRLVTQLFGDRMVIANATGCSSIYGANLPTTPYSKNSNGMGPAWSNSLFEDNAEYGLGMRMAMNQNMHIAQSLLHELKNEIGNDLVNAILNNEMKTESEIIDQRQNIATLKSVLTTIKNDRATMLDSLADSLVKKSLWIIGGDGWAYDIGYGGLDHVLHSGQNVNILVMDTEGYSNTGGQQSKATPFGASMKFAVGGKDQHKKDLGMIAMMSGAYVAQIALGADQAQAIRAIREAEAFNGPSLILAYSPCIAHGFELSNGAEHQQKLVKTGAWPLYRFNPDLIESNTAPLIMDSGEASLPLSDFVSTEGRFNIVRSTNATRFEKLMTRAETDNEYRRELKKHISNFALMRKTPKEGGEG